MYFTEKRKHLSPLQKQLNRVLDLNYGSKAILAKHVECTTVQLLAFCKGNENALSLEHQNRLSELLSDMNSNKWQGKARKTGWVTDGDGHRKFVLGITE